MAIKHPKNRALGAPAVRAFPKVQYDKIVEIIDVVNGLTGGTGDASVDDLAVADDATIAGDLTVTGTSTFNGAIVLGDAAADSLTITATTTYGEPINYDNATAITAFATGGQASATALTAEINNVTVCATAGDSVKLPAAVAGKHIYVKNSGAAALDIFPASADSIDALAINLAVRIQPGSAINFYAKDAIVWESDRDQSLTLVAPTTNTGQLEIKAADSAGNFVTTIVNASQAASRTYTIPDAGANASFVQTEGSQTINGVKTFGSAPIFLNRVVEVTADGAISVPSGNVTYMITKAGVAAMTLVNPTATTHDGLRLTFMATTANAHTLDNSAGAGFNDGGAGSDVGTFGGAKGDNIVIEAYQGKWYVVSKVNVTLA